MPLSIKRWSPFITAFWGVRKGNFKSLPAGAGRCVGRLIWLLLILASLQFSSMHLYGQALDWELWSVERGLSNRNVKFATYDPNGFMWLVSSDIEKYDGHKFTRYTKFDEKYKSPVSSVNTAIRIRDSLLLVSEKKQLFAFNMLSGDSREFPYPTGMDTSFNVLMSMIQKDHHPDLIFITSFVDRKEVTLVDSNWRTILKYPILSGTSLSSAIARSYANGPSGVLWLMDISQNEIVRISTNQTTITHYDFARVRSGVEFRIIYHYAYGLVIVSSDGVIDRIAEDSNQAERLMDFEMECSSLSSVHFERSGALWLTCPNALYTIDLEQKSAIQYSDSPLSGLKPEMYQIFEDAEATTWYCTEIGLIKVNENLNPFDYTLKAEQGDVNIQFREIIPWPDEKTLVCRIGQRKRSLVQIQFDDRGNAEVHTLFDNVPGSGLFVPYDGKLYHLASGQDELAVYNPESQEVEIKSLPYAANGDYYNQYLIDTAGFLHYFDSLRNIVVVDIADFSYSVVETERKDILDQGRGRVFFINKRGEYVLGSGNHGVLFYSSEGDLLDNYSLTTTPALSSAFVNDIVEDSNAIYWIATLGGGLNKLDRNQETVEFYTTNDGIPNNLIASITEDDFGQLWIGTYYGLSRFDKSTSTFYNYFENDGLSNNEFNYLASYKGESGKLYIGTFNGLMWFDPQRVVNKLPLPKVILTSVEKYDRRSDSTITYEYHLNSLKQLVMTPYDNYLQLEFGMPVYRESGSYFYKTYLEGVDKNWQDLGKNNYIRIRRIEPGDYNLLVKGYDIHGNESASVLSVKIRVKQIYYKTWWFLSILGIVIFILAYVIYKYRTNLIRREAETRTRISVDLHDEIGSALTRISLQLQMLEMQVSQKSRETVASIGEVVDNSITKLRDMVWSVDTSSDSWQDVLSRMESYAFDTLRPRDILFHMDVEGINPDKELGPLEKRNVYLIFKEAINNIAKHSTGKTATVKIENRDGGFRMSVVNDTCLDKEYDNQGGNGLSNLAMRAERIGGKLNHGYSESIFRIELKLQRNL